MLTCRIRKMYDRYKRRQLYCDEELDWLLNDMRHDLLHWANGLCIVIMYLQMSMDDFEVHNMKACVATRK